MVHPMAKMSQEVSRKCHPRNMMVQLSTYTKSHKAQRHIHMDRQMNDNIMKIADHTVCSSDWLKKTVKRQTE